MLGRGRTGVESIERRKKMAKALALREVGASYRQIAAALEVAPATAYGYVADALAELTREPAESVLQLELSRLDTMMHGVWLAAAKGELQAIDRVLKIMERRAKLTGVDQLAAQKVAQDGRSLPAVDAWLEAILTGGPPDSDPSTETAE